MISLTSIFRGELSESEGKDLESELEEIIRNTKRIISYSREFIIGFADYTGDYNPWHRDPEAARSAKFGGVVLDDVIVPGAHHLAVAEGFGKVVPEIMRKIDRNLATVKITGMKAKFIDYVYPDRGIEFSFGEPKEMPGEGGIILPIITKMEGKQVADIDITIGSEYPRGPCLAAPVIQGPEGKLGEIGKREMKEYETLTFANYGKLIPHMIAGARIPGTLLAYTNERIGHMTGLNRSMNLSFLGRPEMGRIQTDVHRPQRKPRENKAEGSFIYTHLPVIVGQYETSRPLVYGQLNLISPEKIDFEPTV